MPFLKCRVRHTCFKWILLFFKRVCGLTAVIFLGSVGSPVKTVIMSESSRIDANVLAQNISSNIQRITQLSK